MIVCDDCGGQVVPGYYDQHGPYVWLNKDPVLGAWCPMNRERGHRVDLDS